MQACNAELNTDMKRKKNPCSHKTPIVNKVKALIKIPSILYFTLYSHDKAYCIWWPCIENQIRFVLYSKLQWVFQCTSKSYLR